MNIWLQLKIALILVGTLINVYSGAMTQHAVPPITANILIVQIIFGILGLQLIFGIQALNKYSDKKWEKPSWSSNPFNLKQPVQFFHFGGWFMFISTIPTVALTYFQSNAYIYDALMPFLFGVGIIGGVHASTIFFKFRYKNV